MQFYPPLLSAAYSRRYPFCGKMCTAALSGVLSGHKTRLTIKFVIYDEVGLTRWRTIQARAQTHTQPFGRTRDVTNLSTFQYIDIFEEK